MSRLRKKNRPVPPAQQPPDPRAGEVGRSVQTYSGPLPPSSELAEYDRILPVAADRIVTMAVKDMPVDSRGESVHVAGPKIWADKIEKRIAPGKWADLDFG